ncbi:MULTISPECIES: ribbon-helix-helix protein, CopG family [unclassified Aurantimonas]|uniref:ribbon-helix-helix protein, CopG family n=1 Tax=unclassified Aurantimonas TaxID=2638230 RepID=UPI002E185A70|nr:MULTISPECIES: ribbon-helix-helix protein, CopG family [unclassified Aurantimonas]MEC5293499.1 ribbon-helix-helix protein, CopG family [Aurantimonas sp. C2-3-R2]MEC5414565.1 ribbon-helix-helix protein, CopG family [Aurantimonas sp. C2-4-R8]
MATKHAGIFETRARRRAQGLRSMEVVAHESEIAVLDRLKARLGVASRSEVIRILIAKADPDTITPADAVMLEQSAA